VAHCKTINANIGRQDVRLRVTDSYIVSQKGSHLTFDNNFGNCGPISKILLPIHL